jgi:hypothetical protein
MSLIEHLNSKGAFFSLVLLHAITKSVDASTKRGGRFKYYEGNNNPTDHQNDIGRTYDRKIYI